MDSLLVFLQDILNDPFFFLFEFQETPPPGELQYCGPHFFAVISYAAKLASENSLATFRDGLTILDKAACGCWCSRTTTGSQNFLNLMVSFLIEIRTEIREFFVIPKLEQYPNITSRKVGIIARFINFMVDIFQKLLSTPTHSWIIVPGQIGILSTRIKLLVAILPDTPFQCIELEERENILAEIEFVANEVGIFLYSFFFTADLVTVTTVDLELSLLLSKLEVVEEKIKEYYVTVFEEQKFTTLNLASSSIFIVDSLLDHLNHILNHKIDLTVEVKDQVTTLHEELCSSRSMIRNMELQENKELIECEIQLINLAYQVEPIVVCLVDGEVPIWYLAVRLSSFIRKSKPIRANLATIKLNSGSRCLQIAESSSEVSSSQVATSIPMVDDIIVGFNEMTRQLASQLIGEPNRLQIISIVGMGGLGKTTLARKLYNDSNVLRRFDRHCWCVVSRTYQRKKLLIDILSCMPDQNKDEIEEMEDNKLVERIYKSLKGIRYLLIVDDIWEKQVWDDLKRYFPNDENGSRILFTTRNKDVAQGSIINELPLLTDDQCWDLLHTKVFPNSVCPLALQDVGKKIANNCKGLPLRVVGIAAILANMEKKEELWQGVATSISSYISKDDILELSYKHLPSHLKPCFLYLGMFKEDEEIRVKMLLSLWISQGFIRILEDKSLEDVAQDYLLELINRSMVQVPNARSDKGFKTCIIHDLIREMCLKLADKENFFKVIDNPFKRYSIHSEMIFFGQSVNWRFANFLNPLITSSMIRLKILKLLAHSDTIEYDGNALELLVQLRHLECVGTLRNFSSHMRLEFLTLKVSDDIHTRLNMPRLRHLHFYFRKYQRIPEAWYDSLPNGLQTLSRIIISDLNDEMRLRRFSSLRRLKCLYGEKWDNCPDFVDLSSFAHLVSLHIKGWLSKDFKFSDFPVNIKKLTICMMPLTPEALLSIGALPNLEILKMERLPFTEMRWDLRDDLFMKLKFLKLHGVIFREWNTSEYNFPSLEKLLINFKYEMCPLPCELGYIPTLQMIEVSGCNDTVLSYAMKIMEEQEAEGNEQLEVIIHR